LYILSQLEKTNNTKLILIVRLRLLCEQEMAEEAKHGNLFFLGAGASVAADVPATFKLVECFLRELESREESKKLEFLKKLLLTLRKCELGQNGVDVELLLETLNQLESLSECIPLKFFENGKCILGDNFEIEATELRKELQNFIKKKGLVEKSKIQYLKDLLMFIEVNSLPLDIFSVNYDICIEQFCNVFKKEYVDGFYLEWEPKSLERKDVNIRLYKIHGSITWYETERGRLVKLPVKTESAEIELMTGEKATPLMLYPMRKLEYSEPLISLLMILRDKLNSTDFAFIVGYSFRDNQLKRVFWNAARKNKELVLFLITPSAHEIYEKKLRKYDNELGIPSDLDGRVICLPYKFERVLPFLSEYLRNATNGLRMLRENKITETMRFEEPNWDMCLPSLIKSEHIAKIEEVLQKGAWEQFIKNAVGPQTIELAFMAFLTSLMSGNVAYRNAWLTRFLNLFSPIVATIEFDTQMSLLNPESINLNMRQSLSKEGGVPSVKIKELFNTILANCKLKSSLVNDYFSKVFSTVSDYLEKIRESFSIKSYSIDEYIQLRKQDFPKETNEIASLAKKYIAESKTAYPEDLRTKIPQIVDDIETQELSKKLAGFKSILETLNLA
jgi:hypothetical protein